MNIRRAELKDLMRIMEIYDIARNTMRKNGNDKQWINGFPQKELIEKDIKKRISWVVTENEKVHAVFALLSGKDPTYSYIEDGSWPSEKPYKTIHRIASDGELHGIVEAAKKFALKTTDNIRIDTHELNKQMNHTLLKNGFQRCGKIYIEDGSPRIAYQFEKRKRNFR